MNAHIIREIEDPVVGRDGATYRARIAGRRGPDGRWEGWLEFSPVGGGPVLRSRRETTQSHLESLEHWARGVSHVYVEGSLARTRDRDALPVAPSAQEHDRPSRFEGPAPDLRFGPRPAPDDVALNPIVQYRMGVPTLRTRLRDLAPAELKAIALAYHFDGDGVVDLDTLDRWALEALIIESARARAR